MSSKILLLLILTILLQQSRLSSVQNCNNIIIHEEKELHLKWKSGLKRANSTTLYYSSSVASFNIVLPSDAKKNQDFINYPQNVPNATKE